MSQFNFLGRSMKKIIFCGFLVFFQQNFAQTEVQTQSQNVVQNAQLVQNSAVKTVEEKIEDRPNTIENQFIDIIETSNNWEQYKVISKVRIHQLKKNVQDSLKLQYALNIKNNQKIESDKAEIQNLNQKIESLQQDLDKISKEKNSFNFLGLFLISKEFYSTLVWGIILVLLGALSFVTVRFFRANLITKKAENDLRELSQEYEEYRTKSLEKEQKLGRQLQDLINKNRTS